MRRLGRLVLRVMPDAVLRPARRLRDALRPYAQRSYSQEGEDMILRRLFETQPSGFYVDVGAHHPYRFSNTYAFYRQGWFGLNIDALPGTEALFRRARPRDITIEAAVADCSRELNYYMFDEPALNGFSQELSCKAYLQAGYRLLGTKVMRTRTLAEILSSHLPPGTRIDFMSVDVEGLDLAVLQSNDWARFSPRLVLAEALGPDGRWHHGEVIGDFLADHGYRWLARTLSTVFYAREDEAWFRPRSSVEADGRDGDSVRCNAAGS